MQSGKLSYEPKRLNMKLLVENIESVLKYGANLKSITIYNGIDEKSSWVNADEEMMRSLFHNLLSNSIKFTPNGGRIDLTSKFVDDNLIEFSVYDSGVGISEESIMKLFKTEGFYTTPGTNKEKGTGLGLLLCKEILEKHGSDLMVESSPGKGAKFYFGLK
jgi:signal transduction histidine kinase